MEDIVWGGAASPINRSEIERSEAFLGVHFPSDFVACISENNEGTPEPNWIPIATGGHELFDHLISFRRDDPYNVVRTAALLFEHLPVKVIPFAQDGGGNFFLFDFRTTPEAPPIVFIFHEDFRHGEDDLPSDDALTPVAENFTELLSKLRTDPFFEDEKLK